MMQEQQPVSQMPSFSTGFVEVPGGQLYYEVAGSGHPLVLCSLDFFDRRIWDEQFAALAHFYRVVRYDGRGFGKSAPSTEQYTRADDLAEILHLLKIESAYLLDMSGHTALDFAHIYPSYVDALLLTSPNISTQPSIDDAMATLPQILERYAPMVEAIQQNDMPRAIDEGMKTLWLSPSLPPETYQRMRELVADMLALILSFPLPPTPDIEGFNTRFQWYPHIQVPTLLLMGENAPPEIQAGAAMLDQYIPGVRRSEIAQSQFLLNVEQPEAFNRAVLEFLQTLP